jgi:hypothetical protein
LGQLGDDAAAGVGLAVAVVLFGLQVVYQQRPSVQVGR